MMLVMILESVHLCCVQTFRDNQAIIVKTALLCLNVTSLTICCAFYAFQLPCRRIDGTVFPVEPACFCDAILWRCGIGAVTPGRVILQPDTDLSHRFRIQAGVRPIVPFQARHDVLPRLCWKQTRLKSNMTARAFLRIRFRHIHDPVFSAARENRYRQEQKAQAGQSAYSLFHRKQTPV